ncbi:8-oxo-dGTP pyrophosphatase MutT (NUDIX family) [Streptacidiphilus sp. BW17]|uniref:NUDIX domain-containing protein n=1 Tax=Streptacidiphilus sp. BW17 TaxID=3156274 RepID=UPI00351562CA
MTGNGADRQRAARLDLQLLLERITPFDVVEEQDLATVRLWVASGAPLWRTAAPDEPPMHLVSYVVPVDRRTGAMLLVDHRRARLRLPPGGHVEPLEHPWTAAARETREELAVEAVPSPITGRDPLFATVTVTRGPGVHTDVSLWHVLAVDRDCITDPDRGEFSAVHWLTPEQVLASDPAGLDPRMHAFTRKLQALWDLGA